MPTYNWRDWIKSLPDGVYFSSRKTLHSASYFDYLNWKKPTSKARSDINAFWNDGVITRLANCPYECLRQVGARLRREWKAEKAARHTYWETLRQREDEEEARRAEVRDIKQGARRQLSAGRKAVVDESIHDLNIPHGKYQGHDDVVDESQSSTPSTRASSLRSAGKRTAAPAPEAPIKRRRSKRDIVVVDTKDSNDDEDDDKDDDKDDGENDDKDDGEDDNDKDEDGSGAGANNNNKGVFLSQSLFEEGGDVDQFFFDNPVSEWKNTSRFCKVLLRRNLKTSCKAAFKRYTGSLLVIARKAGVEKHIQDHARKCLGIREVRFRTHYLTEENEIVQSALEKEPTGSTAPQEWSRAAYIDLLSNQPLFPDPLDLDFVATSDIQSVSSSSQDLTGEIPEPIGIDYLVGPGTFSSWISNNPEDRLLAQGYDISDIFMKYRRSKIKHAQIAKDDLLLVNFVFTRKQALALVPAAAVDEVFPPHVPTIPSPSEQDFVTQLSTKANQGSFEELSTWFAEQSGMRMSVMCRAASSFLAEPGLWSKINYYDKGSGNNEDSFIANLVKPLCGAAFGTLVGSAFRWTRDPHRSGKATDIDARLSQPDYQVSLGSHSFVLGEFKTPTASEKEMQDDYTKLVYMGKKSVDGLFKIGYPCPVVLIHGRGMEVDVYQLSLRAEAVYHLQSLGTFNLLSGPYQFTLLLGLGPLISAQHDQPLTLSCRRKESLQTEIGSGEHLIARESQFLKSISSCKAALINKVDSEKGNQPVDQNGNYPWEASTSSNAQACISGKAQTSPSTKAGSTRTNQHQRQSPGQQASSISKASSTRRDKDGSSNSTQVGTSSNTQVCSSSNNKAIAGKRARKQPKWICNAFPQL
ncbi:MAG: hypothetical protein J3Q66DRAFT_421258 [Benniella sp.]|nr:MAG: hypothetical protein J3Q66DRAFT_421258 [Benniella sp.]